MPENFKLCDAIDPRGGAWHPRSMIRAVLLDIAGVVYQGEQPLPGAVDAVADLRQAGFRLRFLTNTTRMPRRALLSRLNSMGIAIAGDELFTPVARRSA